MKAHHDNENDPLPFITLGAATLNVVRYLQSSQSSQDQQPAGKRDAETEQEEIEKAEAQRRYVDRRLRDIAEFEKRARGK